MAVLGITLGDVTELVLSAHSAANPAAFWKHTLVKNLRLSKIN